MPRPFVAAVLIIGLTLPLSRGAASTDAAAWYSPEWKYRQKITVNHELVGGSVDGFPMLVKLTGGVFEYAQSDGADILFTAADGTTKLLHEIESMNGEVVAWVQMPHLSEIEDTVLYAYYGNPTAENQQQATNVWGSSYTAVYHMNDEPGGPQKDSTANQSEASLVNMDSGEAAASGKIGGAVNLDGTEDHLTLSVGLNRRAGTISHWLKPDQVRRMVAYYESNTATGG